MTGARWILVPLPRVGMRVVVVGAGAGAGAGARARAGQAALPMPVALARGSSPVSPADAFGREAPTSTRARRQLVPR
ncbi:hypothetical protein H696_04497 [Fonticula alba]|uniref:Uncharacterized protein n=1 Tax=Fonticula alba TaxID=691883 RepID=A0A058Z6D5_FONAL|nr:hypothetical protein H696_04497 [Fonticula alba]KCV69082.1 hypothetical protein H696_04497 [Fonticula alba]|eukprot:XP_009496653.1 hypothetical protein H696_04497 [Fonticula alba]